MFVKKIMGEKKSGAKQCLFADVAESLQSSLPQLILTLISFLLPTSALCDTYNMQLLKI